VTTCARWVPSPSEQDAIAVNASKPTKTWRRPGDRVLISNQRSSTPETLKGKGSPARSSPRTGVAPRRSSAIPAGLPHGLGHPAVRPAASNWRRLADFRPWPVLAPNCVPISSTWWA